MATGRGAAWHEQRDTCAGRADMATGRGAAAAGGCVVRNGRRRTRMDPCNDPEYWPGQVMRERTNSRRRHPPRHVL